MEIKVKRIKSDDDATLSLVYVDDEFVCFGLEDEYREHKIAKETRIPAGTYNVLLRKTGGFHSRYARKFPGIHRGMLHVQDVPGFEYILIHIGNTDDNTDGCLLVGHGASTEHEYTITHSASAYRDLYQRVVGAAELAVLTITYEDHDI